MKKLLLLLSVLFLFSCNENETPQEETPKTQTLTLGSDVTAKFSGIVTDLAGEPVAMAQISVGGQTALTDVNGVFSVQNANVKEKLAFVKAAKSGFMSASRSLIPSASGTNMVYISMIPSNVVATISSGIQQTAMLPNGSKLVFPGGFKDANGTAYNGNVTVSAYHLEKSNPKISTLMPGMLFGQNTANEARALETYGMMNVELTGTSGQKLQPSAAVTMKMKIDASQTANAPAAIPLWHFDEVKGYWVEEGSASKVGNEYVGSVSHFSWWSCINSNPPITLTLNLFNNASQPISGVVLGVDIFSQNHLARICGVTNSNGQTSIVVPANTTFDLVVYSQGCSSSSYSQNIGPFAVSTTLPTINLSTAMANVSTINGNLVNCNNNPVTNGYVLLKNNGFYTLQVVTNGTFSFSNIFCASNATFKIEGYDTTNLQIAPEVSFTMNNSNSVNLGNIIACTAITEYISYTVDGVTKTITTNIDTNYYPSYNYVRINGGITINNNLSVVLSGVVPGNYSPVQTPGTGYTATGSNFSGTPGNSNTVSGYPNGVLPASPLVFTLNTWPAIGGYIDINFSGNYWYTGTSPYTATLITGTVHVIRDN